MSALPAPTSSLAAVMAAVVEVSKLATLLIEKNNALLAAVITHADALKIAPEAGPPPPQKAG